MTHTYWLVDVDPKTRRITVLRLRGQRYVVHGTVSDGQEARSHLLTGFSVDVASLFAGPATE